MSKTPRISLWFAGTAAVFFTRAFMFSSWVSRGPEVQAALGINTAEMGLLSMLYPAGGMAGILFAGHLVQKFGSRAVNAACYTVAAIGFFILGQAVEMGNVSLAIASLFVMGFTMAISDFQGNFEATNVNRASKHSLFPVIHGSFGVGMLVGAAVASWFISASVPLGISFTAVAIFMFAGSILAGFTFPILEKKAESKAAKAKLREQSIKVWFEKRTLLIAIVGFAFIMAEMSAGVWVPIALTRSGFSAAEAASAFGVLWIVITIARLVGGYISDLLGRFKVVLLSTIVTSIGLLIFMNVETLHLPYLGLIVWGFGFALGFPMSVMAMGDDPEMAPPRVNMIISVVYIASITVGPALGAVGQAFGIYVAFAIPLAVMILAAILSPVIKPASGR